MRTLLILLAAALALPSPAMASSSTTPQNPIVVFVAPRGTPAHARAEELANGQTGFAERALWRGLEKAAELLNGGAAEVRVVIAAGDYTGRFDEGVWRVPAIDNPNGTLHISGGWNDQFNGRQPFGLPVRLVTTRGRDGAILQFDEGTALREVVVSGLLIDGAPSNAYDVRTNSLKKGESRHTPLVSFGRLTSEKLVIADNVFMNGDNRSVRLTWGPASPDAEVHVLNNFFLNNVANFETKIYGRRISDVGRRLVFRNNSFLMNWPYNPDPASSNVSAVELHNAESFRELVFERNLFAYNPGGALQHDAPVDRMPELALRENLFYLNGALWGDAEPGGAVVAGKFGLNPIYRVLDLGSVEDDLDGDIRGNGAFDPEVPVIMQPFQGVDSGSIQAQPTVVNEVRRLFGLNTDGGTVAIQNFAPPLSFDVRLVPVPRSEEARAYGVQPTELYPLQ